MMKSLAMASVLAAGVMAAGSAGAVTLSLIGGTASAIPANFSLAAETGLSIGDASTDFFGATKVAGEGLSLDTAATVTVTFIGFEAGFENEFTLNGMGFNNKVDAIGSSFSTTVGAGLIDFAFSTLNNGKSIENAGGGDAGADFSVAALTASSAIILFDDPTRDIDFDDLAVLIEVVPVPLPASAMLFVIALGGMGMRARRRSMACDCFFARARRAGNACSRPFSLRNATSTL